MLIELFSTNYSCIFILNFLKTQFNQFLNLKKNKMESIISKETYSPGNILNENRYNVFHVKNICFFSSNNRQNFDFYLIIHFYLSYNSRLFENVELYKITCKFKI